MRAGLNWSPNPATPIVNRQAAPEVFEITTVAYAAHHSLCSSCEQAFRGPNVRNDSTRRQVAQTSILSLIWRLQNFFCSRRRKVIPDLFDLTGRVALITGGTGALGMVFARTLAEYGSHIVLIDIDHERCNQCAGEISNAFGHRALGLRCDVSDRRKFKPQFAAPEEEFGRIDILINNAAAQPPGFCTPFEEYPLDVWNRVMAVNLTGPFLMARAVAPVLLRQKKGNLINICSTYGVVAPNQHIYDGSGFNTPPVYSASKSGILGLTRYLATYWAEQGIRINSITPGGMFRGHTTRFCPNYCARVPMARMGQQDELRGAVIYLASDASSYVTGPHNTCS